MDNTNIPRHIAFIMDGNRRWAKERHLPTLTGHSKGYRRMEPIVEYAQKRGIKHVTFWAFSTENWKRSKEEVEYLMNLFRELFKSRFLKKLMQNGGRIIVLGELEPFPVDIQENIKKVIEQSKDNTNIIVNIGLNYGGRAEILRAVNAIVKEIPSTPFSKGGQGGFIDEKTFSSYLYTKDQPDPDMVIRTGGEQRLSGFLSWQAVYSELYFTDTYWPDFDEKKFAKALEEYANRERRFGK